MTVRTEMIRGDAPAIDDPVLRTFVAELGGLWHQVAPWFRDPGADVLPALPTGARCDVREIEALLAGWPHFGPVERSVLYAALSFLDEPAGCIGSTRGVVVDAAVRALLRGPRR